jgi:hypothetical protein
VAHGRSAASDFKGFVKGDVSIEVVHPTTQVPDKQHGMFCPDWEGQI